MKDWQVETILSVDNGHRTVVDSGQWLLGQQERQLFFACSICQHSMWAIILDDLIRVDKSIKLAIWTVSTLLPTLDDFVSFSFRQTYKLSLYLARKRTNPLNCCLFRKNAQKNGNLSCVRHQRKKVRYTRNKLTQFKVKWCKSAVNCTSFTSCLTISKQLNWFWSICSSAISVMSHHHWDKASVKEYTWIAL